MDKIDLIYQIIVTVAYIPAIILAFVIGLSFLQKDEITGEKPKILNYFEGSLMCIMTLIISGFITYLVWFA